MDVLVRSALLFDGSGAPSVRADVLVRGDRIAAVGTEATNSGASLTIDADGLALAPGFIDMHSHADHTLPAFAQATNSITQGVTTEVVGLCGFSPAPVSADPNGEAQLQDLARGIGPHLDWTWHAFGDFLDRFDAARPAVNVVSLVGHHALRILAMGMDDRAPSASELVVMREALADALEHGAWGMSTGLVYVPGAFASLDELLELAAVLQRYDAMYVSHLRDEADKLGEAIAEALTLGERYGIRVQISHLKITAQRNAGHIGRVIAQLDRARDTNIRAHADVYPYTAGSTYLHQVLPPWVKVGGLEAMVDRLQVHEQRQRIRHDIETDDRGWANHVAAAGGWHNIMLASINAPRLRSAEGLRVADAARDAQQDPLEYVLDLLIADRGSTTMIVFHMDERDMQEALRWRYSAVGSDQLGVTSPHTRVHPRAYGTFVRVLGWGVREAQLFPLETAINKMTGLPAAILGLGDRGRVAAGAVADLVLFDPGTVADAATYAEPTLQARGVEYVMVGGEFAVERGAPVRLDLGRVIRRGL